jgi:invasion protein IalB
MNTNNDGVSAMSAELGGDLPADEAWSLHCGSHNTADQCRLLGIEVGDTIEGMETSGHYWHQARLTLLWLGEEVAVFRVTDRSNSQPEWSEPEESGDWTLECRVWRKLLPNGAA